MRIKIFSYNLVLLVEVKVISCQSCELNTDSSALCWLLQKLNLYLTADWFLLLLWIFVKLLVASKSELPFLRIHIINHVKVLQLRYKQVENYFGRKITEKQNVLIRDLFVYTQLSFKQIFIRLLIFLIFDTHENFISLVLMNL